jgi:hypothetical protein
VCGTEKKEQAADYNPEIVLITHTFFVPFGRNACLCSVRLWRLDGKIEGTKQKYRLFILLHI